MNDRELLKMAANAAGIGVTDYCDGSDGRLPHFATTQGKRWNPLAKDSDALPLAVALRLTVAIRLNECEVFDDWGDCLASVPIFHASAFVPPDHATDPCAATRRAITLAAAEISRLTAAA